MPSRNIVKQFDVPAFYHVYNRASGERNLFRDDDDRIFFMSLLQKYLTETDIVIDQKQRELPKYEVELIAYCLMSSHFHLLLYQYSDTRAIEGYMRSVSTVYSIYYNKKYKSKGHVFQSSYKASHMSNEAYLEHITRYIHLNPRRYKSWGWSSYQDYVDNKETEWLHPERVLSDRDRKSYADFVAIYADKDRREQSTELSDFIAF